HRIRTVILDDRRRHYELPLDRGLRLTATCGRYGSPLRLHGALPPQRVRLNVTSSKTSVVSIFSAGDAYPVGVRTTSSFGSYVIRRTASCAPNRFRPVRAKRGGFARISSSIGLSIVVRLMGSGVSYGVSDGSGYCGGGALSVGSAHFSKSPFHSTCSRIAGLTFRLSSAHKRTPSWAFR